MRRAGRDELVQGKALADAQQRYEQRWFLCVLAQKQACHMVTRAWVSTRSRHHVASSHEVASGHVQVREGRATTSPEERQ